MFNIWPRRNSQITGHLLLLQLCKHKYVSTYIHITSHSSAYLVTILLHSLLYAAIPIFITSSGPWWNKIHFIIMPSYLSNYKYNVSFFKIYLRTMVFKIIDFLIFPFLGKINFNDCLPLNVKIEIIFKYHPGWSLDLNIGTGTFA